MTVVATGEEVLLHMSSLPVGLFETDLTGRLMSADDSFRALALGGWDDLSKIGRELVWDYDWSDPMQPWRVTDSDGQIDAVLTPRFDKHSAMEVSADLGSETHQVFGTWSGHLRTDDGLALAFSGLQGFAEEARQRW